MTKQEAGPKPFDPNNYDANNPEDVRRYKADLAIETERQALLQAQAESRRASGDSERAGRISEVKTRVWLATGHEISDESAASQAEEEDWMARCRSDR